MKTESESSRHCSACHQSKPLTDFRRRRAGSEHRHWTCRRCHARHEREREKAKRCGKAIRLAKNFIDVDHPDTVQYLSASVVQSMGGIRRFAAVFREAIDEASRRGNHATVCRTILGLVSLMAHSQPKVEELSDRQLEATIRRSLIDLISEDPEIVIMAAEGLGWKVEKPEANK